MSQRLIITIAIMWLHYNCALMAERSIRVLSLDGGGIRGLIEAVILKDLEKELNAPISSIFDLIAGTSTGGIIALALSVPDAHHRPRYRAQDLVEFYLSHGDQVFSASVQHTIKTGGGLWGPKYDSKGLKKLLTLMLGSTPLSQALTPTLITGFHIEEESGVTFFSEHEISSQIPINLAGLATSAAPVYFASVDMRLNSLPATIADGGLYKNNPALLAYVNATKLYPDREIDVYSLGTGKLSARQLEKQLKGDGLIQWLPPLIRYVQIGNSEADNSVLRQLLNDDEEDNFFRLDLPVDEDHLPLDKISDDNISYLYQKGIESTKTVLYRRMLERLKRDN